MMKHNGKGTTIGKSGLPGSKDRTTHCVSAETINNRQRLDSSYRTASRNLD